MDERENEQLEALASRLDAVEAAMARLDAGTYGSCAQCGGGLEEARLEGDPLVSRFGACELLNP